MFLVIHMEEFTLHAGSYMDVELTRSHMHVHMLRYVLYISSILSIDALEGAIIIFTLMWYPAVAISCRWSFCCGINRV